MKIIQASPRARARCAVMDGSGVSVIGVSPAAAYPISASQFPDNRENNRESAKFPVISALAGVNSSSNFNRLPGIPCCPLNGESLSNFNGLRVIPCCSRNREIFRPNRELGIPSPVVGLRGGFRPALTPFVFSREIVLPKLHRPAATRRLFPGWCAHMVEISRFDRFGILYPLACSAARHAG
jgi:hypothetical protein